jgi:hypothetical protein
MNQGWASGNSIHEPHPAESTLSRTNHSNRRIGMSEAEEGYQCTVRMGWINKADYNDCVKFNASKIFSITEIFS